MLTYLLTYCLTYLLLTILTYYLLTYLVGDAQVAAVGLQRRLHLWRVASQQRRCFAAQRLAHVGLQHGLCTAGAWGCSLWREVHVAAAPS